MCLLFQKKQIGNRFLQMWLPHHSVTRTTSNYRTTPTRPTPWHIRRSDIFGYDARPFPRMHRERSRRPNHPEQSKFPETLAPTKTLKTILEVWVMVLARGRDNRHRVERQVSSRTAHGIWTKATVGARYPPILGNDGFAIGGTPGV